MGRIEINFCSINSDKDTNAMYEIPRVWNLCHRLSGPSNYLCPSFVLYQESFEDGPSSSFPTINQNSLEAMDIEIEVEELEIR